LLKGVQPAVGSGVGDGEAATAVTTIGGELTSAVGAGDGPHAATHAIPMRCSTAILIDENAGSGRDVIN
jgi:hypothetical protein